MLTLACCLHFTSATSASADKQLTRFCPTCAGKLQVHVRIYGNQVACVKFVQFEKPRQLPQREHQNQPLNLKQRLPLYSMPHLSFTTTGLPVKSFRNGFGLTGTVCTRPHPLLSV